MSESIIIDTDPGVDDALALRYAYARGLPVGAITTIYGNAPLDDVTRNAGYVVKSLGAQWPIYKGASGPLAGRALLSEAHGTVGLGNVVPQDSEVVLPQALPARDYLGRLAMKGTTYNLLCLGPLTNIAEAMRQPKVVQNIGKLIVMGGAFTGQGNIAPHYNAEFNVYNDPLAWREVMDAAHKHRVDATIIPAEVCNKVTLSTKDLEQLERAGGPSSAHDIIAPYVEYYAAQGHQGAVLYDVLVPLYWQHPGLFTTRHVRVDTIVDEGPHYGQTVGALDAISSIKLCTDINATLAKEHVMRSLM